MLRGVAPERAGRLEVFAPTADGMRVSQTIMRRAVGLTCNHALVFTCISCYAYGTLIETAKPVLCYYFTLTYGRRFYGPVTQRPFTGRLQQGRPSQSSSRLPWCCPLGNPVRMLLRSAKAHLISNRPLHPLRLRSPPLASPHMWHTVAGCGGAEKARWKHYISMEESGASMGTYILSVHPRARAVALFLLQEVDGHGWSRRSRCALPYVLRVMRGGPEDCEIASQVWRCGAPLFLM